MYTIFDIEDMKTHENAVIFRFNGQKMTVENGTMRTVEIPREELESLVEWLRCGLEKMNRDYWDSQHQKTACCDCVRPA
jgi:hypothetical protein